MLAPISLTYTGTFGKAFNKYGKAAKLEYFGVPIKIPLIADLLLIIQEKSGIIFFTPSEAPGGVTNPQFKI